MSFFRKKPVVIEATRFLDTAEAIAAIAAMAPGWDVRVNYFDPEKPTIAIETLEGRMTVQVGDWVIRGVRGELYPCKSDIFELTYDRVED